MSLSLVPIEETGETKGQDWLFKFRCFFMHTN